MAEQIYLDGLMQAYQGEVRGEAGFTTQAERATNPDEARKWRVLARLETVTKGRLKPLLEAHGLDTAEDEAQRRRGIERGIARAELGWDQALQAMAKSLPHFIELYGRLEAMAPTQDRDGMAFLMAHEIALLEFVHLELKGEGDVSLDPILPLIDEKGI